MQLVKPIVKRCLPYELINALWWLLRPEPSNTLGFWRLLLLKRYPFRFLVQLRLLYLELTRKPVFLAVSEEERKGFDRNFRYRHRFGRQRVERWLRVCAASNKSFRDSRLLIIGPRNEAELILAWLHGFRWDNIFAIDLFSVSPKIAVMNAERMDFPDDSFDIVVACAVLPYIPNASDALREMARICRPGGILLLRNSYYERLPNPYFSRPMDRYLGSMEAYLDYVFFREKEPIEIDLRKAGIADSGTAPVLVEYAGVYIKKQPKEGVAKC